MIKKLKSIDIKYYIYLCVSLIFIICYSCAGSYSYVGDFTQDYPLIKSFIEDGVNYNNLFFSRGFEASLIYNLLVLINVNAFSLSFAFVKVMNFFASFGLFTLIYFMIVSKKTNNIYNIVVTSLLSILLLNFYSIFEFNSQLLTKISLLSALGTYLLIDKSFKTENKIHKYIYLGSALLLITFSYSLFALPLIGYFFTKLKGQSKTDKIIIASTLSSIIIVPTLVNSTIFTNIGSDVEFVTRVKNILNSLFVPNILYQPYGSYKILYLLVALASVSFLVFYFVYKIVKKSFDFPFFVLISLGVAMFSQLLSLEDNPSYYSSMYVLNSCLMTLLIWDLFARDDDSKKFNLFNDEPIKFNVNKFVTILVLAVASLSQSYSFESRIIHQNSYDNLNQDIAHSIKYDYFNAKEFSGYTFANCTREEYIEIMSFYNEHNLINTNYKIQQNHDYTNIHNVEKFYGIYDKDFDGSYWTSKIFSFNFYNQTQFIDFDVFLSDLNAPNSLSLYINNEFNEKFDLVKGFNKLFIDASKYEGQNIVVTGIVENSFVGESDPREFGIKLVNINSNERFGFYGKEYDNSEWVSDKFVFNQKIDNSVLTINCFEIEDLNGNEINIYVDDQLYKTQILYSGVNTINIVVKDLIGKTVTIRGELKLSKYSENDGRKLSLLINNIYSSNNYGFYGKEYDGSIWTSDSFGFTCTLDCDYLYFKTFEIDSLMPNNIIFYIDGEKILQKEICGGKDEIYLPVMNFKGKNIFIQGKLSNSLRSSDGRVLGILLNEVNKVNIDKTIQKEKNDLQSMDKLYGFDPQGNEYFLIERAIANIYVETNKIELKGFVIDKFESLNMYVYIDGQWIGTATFNQGVVSATFDIPDELVGKMGILEITFDRYYDSTKYGGSDPRHLTLLLSEVIFHD